jgi:hypothetical protein
MTPEEIAKQLQLIQSNSLDSSQAISLFIGFVGRLILKTDTFKHNSDLEPFILEVFLKPFSKEQFRPYVYRSRTLLTSRVLRLLSDNLTLTTTLKIATRIESILVPKTNTRGAKGHISQSFIDKALDSWMSSIRTSYSSNEGKEK